MSWEQTLDIYEGKAADVRRGVLVLLPDAPGHVPVLAADLEDMVRQLREFERLRRLVLDMGRRP